MSAAGREARGPEAPDARWAPPALAGGAQTPAPGRGAQEPPSCLRILANKHFLWLLHLCFFPKSRSTTSRRGGPAAAPHRPAGLGPPLCMERGTPQSGREEVGPRPSPAGTTGFRAAPRIRGRRPGCGRAAERAALLTLKGDPQRGAPQPPLRGGIRSRICLYKGECCRTLNESVPGGCQAERTVAGEWRNVVSLVGEGGRCPEVGRGRGGQGESAKCGGLPLHAAAPPCGAVAVFICSLKCYLYCKENKEQAEPLAPGRSGRSRQRVGRQSAWPRGPRAPGLLLQTGSARFSQKGGLCLCANRKTS